MKNGERRGGRFMNTGEKLETKHLYLKSTWQSSGITLNVPDMMNASIRFS